MSITHEVRITNFHAAEDARTSTSPFAASSEVVSRHRTPEARQFHHLLSDRSGVERIEVAKQLNLLVA